MCLGDSVFANRKFAVYTDKKSVNNDDCDISMKPGSWYKYAEHLYKTGLSDIEAEYTISIL